jgi:hypothetical protein
MERSENENAPRLTELVTKQKLQEMLAAIFPSENALDWELRQHREAYVAGGAVYQVARRLLFYPPNFERVALDIGRRKVTRERK